MIKNIINLKDLAFIKSKRQTRVPSLIGVYHYTLHTRVPSLINPDEGRDVDKILLFKSKSNQNIELQLNHKGQSTATHITQVANPLKLFLNRRIFRVQINIIHNPILHEIN